MAKYIAYKESGNLLNDAIVKCINEGVLIFNLPTNTGINYTTPVATNTTNITFEGAYLGLTNVTNNVGKTGTIVLGISSIGGLQSFQYPLSTLTDAISSDKVDRTVISTTTVNNARSFYFKFPSPVSANSNYCLFYRVSATATSIVPTYYGIVGNTNVPANLLVSSTALTNLDEIIITPHIKTDGSYIAPVINGSTGNFSCFYFTIERDSTFNLLQSPYTFTIKTIGRLSIIDGGTLNLSAQLPNRGQILMEGDASISLNGGNLSANADYISPYASLLTNITATTATFKVSNINDVKDWSTNDSLLFFPLSGENDFRSIYTLKTKTSDVLTLNATTTAYNTSRRLKDINYDIVNLDSNIIIGSTKPEIDEIRKNSKETTSLFGTVFKFDYPRYINLYKNSNVYLNNTTIKNLGYITTNKGSGADPYYIDYSCYNRKNNWQDFTMTDQLKTIGNGVTTEIWFDLKANQSIGDQGTAMVYGWKHGDYVGAGIRGDLKVACYARVYGLRGGNQPMSERIITSTQANYIQPNTWYNFYITHSGNILTVNYKKFGDPNYILGASTRSSQTNSYGQTTFGKELVDGVISLAGGGTWIEIANVTKRNGETTVFNAFNAHPSYNDVNIFQTNSNSNPKVDIINSKFVSTGEIQSRIFTKTTNFSNLNVKNTIFNNTLLDLTSAQNVCTLENNTFINTSLSLSDTKDKLFNFKYNTFILKKNVLRTNNTNSQLTLTKCEPQEGLFETSKIYSCRDNTAVSYTPINKENNTIVLSGMRIYNDIPSSNSKSLVINKDAATKYTNPVSVTMVDCDITGSAELNVCNGLIDLKNSIIRQKNTGENTLTLTLSNQNTLINVDNLTCFRNTIANNYGLYIKNENIEFSKPPKITIKNSRIDGGISYDGSSGMVKNILYNLPVNKDTYSINIFNNNINNFNTNAINLVNLWPTQVVNISSVNATRTSITDLPAAINATHRATNALAGKTTYPFNINIRNCNLEGGISLNYYNALEDLLDSKTNPFSRNEVSATSFQNILSTNITKTNTGITLTDLYNPRIYTIIDSLSFTPIAAGANFLKTTLGASKNTLNPYKLDITNSILTGGALTLDNFYGNITNNIVSLSTFDNPMSFGDGPVSIKNNKALVSNLSTGDFIKPDSSCNYSYNINSNYNYCKVELKSVSSFRVDIPNPNTDSIYQESNWVGSRFGLTLASQATAFNYQTRSVSSGSIILSSAAAASTAFATFSLNSKVNFLRFKATSPVNIYAKMFLNEKMVYCGNLISYPFFIINMREFEWNKKDTFHFVMYFTAANTSVTLSDFTFSDNGAEFIPFSINEIGFYNRISHDLITKFKTIHPRKNNRGNYTNLFVDETIESPSYDVDTKLPSVANQPLNQNVIKTGANISLGKIDSKYITSGTTLANIFDATKQQYQYFYNGDMTLYNDDKLISADYDGNLVDTGAPSERVVPRAYLNGKFDHPHRTKSSPKYVALNAGDYAKVFVFVAKTNAYSLNPINAPRLVVAKNVALGIKEDTILDQFTDDMMIDKNYTDWVLLQGSTPAVTNDGVLEFYVDCCGDNVNGTGYINVDSWSASTDNNIGEYWFSDEGETDWNAV